MALGINQPNRKSTGSDPGQPNSIRRFASLRLRKTVKGPPTRSEGDQMRWKVTEIAVCAEKAGDYLLTYINIQT